MPKTRSKKSEYEINSLENKEFYKELVSLAVPVGLQNLLFALIGATDALMLGRLTQDSVAAVSLANQIVFIMSLFTGTIVGSGSTLIAQYWGKGDKTMAKNIFCMVLKWTVAISLVFFALANFIPETLMRIYTSDNNLIHIGSSYLRIVSFSYLFSSVSQCYYMLIKIEGKAYKGVIISLTILIADIIIDLFLIYGLGGMPKLGANGSAYSTVIVELLGMVWYIIESNKKDSIHVDVAGFNWTSHVITRDLIKISLPMLGSALAWGLGTSMHSLIMGHLGTDAVAAASIAAIIMELATCVCIGVSTGAEIIIGKLLGQNLFNKAKKYGRKFCHISFYVGGINNLILFIIGPIAVYFFVLTDTARHYLIMMLLFMIPYLFAFSINAIIVVGVFVAGGDTIYDAISVILASWCFALPLALLGTFVFDWPVMLVYILMCSDEIIKVPWVYPRYKKYIWLRNLTHDNDAKIA